LERDAAGPEGAEHLDVAALRARLQVAMSADAGVLRDAERLDHAAQVVADTAAAVRGLDGIEAAEVRNLAEIAHVLVAAATARTESRGTHARTDHPDTDPAQAHRLVVQHSPR
jgi:L-aspartate oxidase